MTSLLHETTCFKNELNLSAISHELRNPLTLIHSTIQLLGSHHPEITRDPLWRQLNQDVDYMTQLLSELSALNQSQHIKKAEIRIRQFLTDIVTSYLPVTRAQGKSLSLNLHTPSETFYGDPLKLKEVFINLLNNALEATRAGDSIVIEAKSKWNRIVFTVSDSGQGIDEDRLPSIFDPFVTYKQNGTGLGLTIAQNIIKAHGGSIRVWSKPGKGTKFILILPAPEASVCRDAPVPPDCGI